MLYYKIDVFGCQVDKVRRCDDCSLSTWQDLELPWKQTSRAQNVFPEGLIEGGRPTQNVTLMNPWAAVPG